MESPLFSSGTRYAPPLVHPMGSRLIRRLLLTSAIVIAFLVLAPRVAFAQATITIYQEQSLPRADANGNAINKRSLQYTPEGVSYQDCVEDQRIAFPLQMSGFVGNATLQAWASLSGADCGDNAIRTSGVKQCWQLISGIPLTTTQTVYIPVRAIMSGALNPTAPDSSAAICGKVDLTTIGVQFLYFEPGNTAKAAVNKSISVQVDTVGPAPPTGVRTKPGNGRITVEWDNISGEGGVSVLTGVKVYCDPSGSTAIPDVTDGGRNACSVLAREREAVANAAATTSDAGTTTTTDASTSATVQSISPACTLTPIDSGPDGGDAGFVEVCDDDAGTSTPEAPTDLTCSSTNIAPTDGTTVTPSAAFDGCFSCGSITGNTGTTVVAEAVRGTPLTNNRTYTLAVASTDAFNNVGPLSTVVCQYPEETNDFWEAYRSAGGRAGGGCAASGDAPIGSLAAFGAAGAVVASMLRRRRSSK